MQIVWANKKMHKLLGYNPDEMIDISVRKILPLGPKAIMELMSMMIGKKISDTRMIVKKDGKQIKISGVLETFTYDNEPFVVVKIQETK